MVFRVGKGLTMLIDNVKESAEGDWLKTEERKGEEQGLESWKR